MAEVVYILCALTSLACCVLLARGYARSKARLLLWSSVCVAGLALNNALLFVDRAVLPDSPLTVWRSVAALAGLGVLLYALIWEGE